MGLSKKLRGEHITADEWNSLIDAVTALQLPSQTKRTSFPEVKFTASATVPAYGVMGVSDQEIREGLPHITAAFHTSGPIFVNVGSAASKGLCYPIYYPTLVKAAPGASVTVGQSCGPRSGTFEVDESGSGLVALSSVLDGLLWVAGESGSVTNCPSLDIAPGSYPGVAGATILAGETGPILYQGKIYSSVNHSQCPVYVGDKVGLHISPNCEAFFVACVCSCDPPVLADCCDKTIFVCVNGISVAVPLSSAKGCASGDLRLGYWMFFPVGLCCPAWSASCNIWGVPWDAVGFWIRVCCETGVPGTIEAVVYKKCTFLGPILDVYEVLNWSALCDDAVVENEVTLIGNESTTCPVTIRAANTLAAVLCSPCDGGDPVTPCCDRTLFFCVNETSLEIPLTAGDETFDVSACCDCVGASLQLTTSCIAGVPVLGWFYSCGEVTGSGNISLADFCTGITGKILTIEAPCFIQIQVTTTSTPCAPCLFTPTTGTSEPL